MGRPRINEERSCAVCCTIFYCAPSYKKKTCSPECARISYVYNRTGKKWSPEARKRISESRGQLPQLLLGTEAAKKSPIAGGYETNHRAQNWTLVSPAGKIYRIRNLKLFCRRIAPLYGSTANSMQSAIGKIKSWKQGRSNQKVLSWKGWHLLEYEDVSISKKDS